MRSYEDGMTRWGVELWDRYSSVLSHVNQGYEDLVEVYTKYIKERGEVEKEYAKNIRKLSNKYQHKLDMMTLENRKQSSNQTFRYDGACTEAVS